MVKQTADYLKRTAEKGILSLYWLFEWMQIFRIQAGSLLQEASEKNDYFT